MTVIANEIEAEQIVERSLLLVEDNPIHARLVKAALGKDDEGAWRVTWVASLAGVLEVAEPVDMVLLDLSLPDSDGLETLHAVRTRFPTAAIVLLSATHDGAVERGALKAGAQDFLGKEELTPRTLQRVLRYAAERQAMQLALLRLSLRDPLTDLYNRRGFLTVAGPLLRATVRSRTSYLVLFADLDGLKHINDTFGHEAGDAVISEAALALRASFRSSDIIARIGGDEFAVFAMNATQESAPSIMRRLAEREAEHDRQPGRQYRLSLSVGVAPDVTADKACLDSLLAAADAAAYVVKRSRGARRS